MTNLYNVSSECSPSPGGHFSGLCTQVFGFDYALLMLTIIAFCMLFVVGYIIYKEVVK